MKQYEDFKKFKQGGEDFDEFEKEIFSQQMELHDLEKNLGHFKLMKKKSLNEVE